MVSTAEITGSKWCLKTWRDEVLTSFAKRTADPRQAPHVRGGGRSSIETRRYASATGGPEGHYRGSAGAADRSYLLDVFSCSVVKCSEGPAGAGPSEVSGAGRDARRSSGSARSRSSAGSSAADGAGRPAAADRDGCGGRACAVLRCSVRCAMRWLSSAICTSGEPVSPSVVAYSAMIFFFVSASVPTDMTGSSGSRCAARRGLFTRALWIRGRCTAVLVLWSPGARDGWDNLGKAISGRPSRAATPIAPVGRASDAVPWAC